METNEGLEHVAELWWPLWRGDDGEKAERREGRRDNLMGGGFVHVCVSVFAFSRAQMKSSP